MLTILMHINGGCIVSFQELSSHPGMWPCPFSHLDLQSLDAVSSPTLCRELVENSSDIIYSIDDEGYFTYVSPAAKAVTGYDPLELTGKSFFEFVIEEDLVALRKDLQRTLSGEIGSAEYRAWTKSGEIVWLQDLRRPIFKDGRVVSIQLVAARSPHRSRWGRSAYKYLHPR